MDDLHEKHSDGVKEDGPSVSVILPVYDAYNFFLPFVHALKIAQASRGELEIIDVRDESEVDELIGVRPLLEKWGILPFGSQRSDVRDAGLRIKKIIKKGNKKKEIFKRLNRHIHDLLVVGCDSRFSFLQILRRNLAEEIAQNYNNPILFVPIKSKTFVNQETGAVELNSILIAAADSFAFVSAVELVKKLESIFPSIRPLVFSILEKNKADNKSDLGSLQCKEIKNTGNYKDSIIETALQQKTDLIVIAAKNGNLMDKKAQFVNCLQVLKKSSCPIFFLPSK